MMAEPAAEPEHPPEAEAELDAEPEAESERQKEGFLARKKRQFRESQQRKATREELANAREGFISADYLSPSFDSALAVAKGVTVTVLNTTNDDWWKVSVPPRSPRGGAEYEGLVAEVGFVPASFVALAPSGAEARRQAPWTKTEAAASLTAADLLQVGVAAFAAAQYASATASLSAATAAGPSRETIGTVEDWLEKAVASYRASLLAAAQQAQADGDSVTDFIHRTKAQSLPRAGSCIDGSALELGGDPAPVTPACARYVELHGVESGIVKEAEVRFLTVGSLEGVETPTETHDWRLRNANYGKRPSDDDDDDDDDDMMHDAITGMVSWGGWEAAVLRLTAEFLSMHDVETGLLIAPAIQLSSSTTDLRLYTGGIGVSDTTTGRSYLICVAAQLFEKHGWAAEDERLARLDESASSSSEASFLEYSCDGCGHGPIAGVRHKRGNDDFDLCSQCYQALEPAAQAGYTSIDPAGSPEASSSEESDESLNLDGVLENWRGPAWGWDAQVAAVRAEWISAMVPVLDPKFLGVTRAGLQEFVLTHPGIADNSIAQVCGMTAGGGDPPASVTHAWPTVRGPADTCPWSGRSMLPGVVVRETESKQCCYVDLWRGRPDVTALLKMLDVFVSHAWGEPLAVLLECTASFEKEQALSQEDFHPGFWIDVFCKNQWVVNSDDTAAELEACVRRARSLWEIFSPPTVLLVASPWPAPQCLQRVWW